MGTEVNLDSAPEMAPNLTNAAAHDAEEFTTTQSSTKKRILERWRENAAARRVWNVITWTPKRCRWDPKNPPKFNMGLNLLFGFVSVCSFQIQVLLLLGGLTRKVYGEQIVCAKRIPTSCNRH